MGGLIELLIPRHHAHVTSPVAYILTRPFCFIPLCVSWITSLCVFVLCVMLCRPFVPTSVSAYMYFRTSHLETPAVMEVEDYPEHLKAMIAEEEKWEEQEKRREQLEREMCKVRTLGGRGSCVCVCACVWVWVWVWYVYVCVCMCI